MQVFARTLKVSLRTEVGYVDEYALIDDATLVRVHQHGTGAKGDSKSGHPQIARRPDDEDRGDRRWTGSRIKSATSPAVRLDALGNLIRFVPLAGQRHDITSFAALMAASIAWP
jgi:hypothetical protein